MILRLTLTLLLLGCLALLNERRGTCDTDTDYGLDLEE